MTIYRNQRKQVIKVRLPYYGTNTCEPTGLSLFIMTDIIMRDNEKGTRMSVDAAIPGDRNVIKM